MWIDIICLLTIYFSFNYMYTLYYRRFMVDYCNKYTFFRFRTTCIVLAKMVYTVFRHLYLYRC